MASFFEPSGNPVTLEAEVAVFEAELARMGASGEVRAELADRFRAVDLLSGVDRIFATLEVAADVMAVVEEWLRGIGHDEMADRVGGSVSSITMWLALPEGLRHWAGSPVIG